METELKYSDFEKSMSVELTVKKYKELRANCKRLSELIKLIVDSDNPDQCKTAMIIMAGRDQGRQEVLELLDLTPDFVPLMIAKMALMKTIGERM